MLTFTPSSRPPLQFLNILSVFIKKNIIEDTQEMPQQRSTTFPKHQKNFPKHQKNFPKRQKNFPKHQKNFPKRQKNFPKHQKEETNTDRTNDTYESTDEQIRKNCNRGTALERSVGKPVSSKPVDWLQSQVTMFFPYNPVW